MGSVSKVARALGGLFVIVTVVAALVGCAGSSGNGGEEDGFTGSGFPGVDAANTRNPESTIDSSNVSDLSVAWTAGIPGIGVFGRHASTPVIVDGVVYSQDLSSSVQALDLESGDVLWTRRHDEAVYGPNGVAVTEDLVFGATRNEAFALDRESGKEVWATSLSPNKHAGINMAPSFGEGKVFISTSPINSLDDFNKGGGAGVFWALDAKSGKKLWHFDTVPKNLWGNSTVNAGGGVWYSPALDGEGGIYFGVGNPVPFPGTAKYPFGSSRPGPNLYTDSLVKLDAKTGKLDWYHQVTPHDIYDWDFQGPPILMKAGDEEIVVAAGKSGIVLAADAESGRVLWEVKVGKHNGHDDDGLLAMRGEESKIGVPATVYPGSVGGVIAPMSTDGKLVFAPVVNAPQRLTSGGEEISGEKQEPGLARGEVVALDAATGKVEWKKDLSDLAFGGTTVVNDLVFTTDEAGKLWAFETETGDVAWRRQLSAGTNTGVMIAGDTLIAPAGLAAEVGQKSEIAAYRLGG